MVLFVIILLTVISAVAIGFYGSIYLPLWFKPLDIKPFNCQPCLTFHLVWFSFVIVSVLYKLPMLSVVGIIIAFAIFIVIKIIDRWKITK